MPEHSSNPPADPQASPAHRPVALPPGGVSGKRVTTWVVAALLTISIALSFTLWTYSRLDAARVASATAWRKLTPALNDRYRAAQLNLSSGVAADAATDDFQQTLASAIDRFRTTSIVVDQVAAAERVEELLGSREFPAHILPANPPTPQLRTELEHYNQQRQHERRLRAGLGGQLLELFFALPPSTPFNLSTSQMSTASE